MIELEYLVSDAGLTDLQQMTIVHRSSVLRGERKFLWWLVAFTDHGIFTGSELLRVWWTAGILISVQKFYFKIVAAESLSLDALIYYLPLHWLKLVFKVFHNADLFYWWMVHFGLPPSFLNVLHSYMKYSKLLLKD